MTLEGFRIAVSCHDIGFSKSHDKNWWAREEWKLRRIKEISKELPRKEVVEIWNSYVDNTIPLDERIKYYWSE
jgi:hypothetical protein